MTSTMTSTNTGLPRQTSELSIGTVERDELAQLVRRLTDAAPALVDDPGWQALAREWSCRMPAARLGRAVRAFRHDPGPDGAIVLRNLPVEPDLLPPTPNVPDSVERAATAPAALAVLLGGLLGTIVAFRDEKRGALVQNVVPVPSLASTQSNGGSVPLEFHTENAFHPHRPDYIGLLCLRPAHEERVGTRISSIRRALPLVGDADSAILRQPRFLTEAPPSFRSAGRCTPHAVLTGAPEDPDICVDFHATRPLDERAGEALRQLREALYEVRSDVVLGSGDMVFVDNRIVVHGRVSFSPRYDGTDRWLHRVYVHADHRRSRQHRPGNGSVLI